MSKKRILSGMRPTGKLHLGHLVGALNNWIKFQDKYECFFMVADWHALMSEYENPKNLSENILDNAADWLAAGIDPEKSTLFVQSQVGAHLDLFMIFSCLTPLGWLERCPTYKEQLREVTTRNLNTYGFLGYPVLQAADILLYKADKVPVGEDQLPHLELTREIARRFNSLHKKEIFPAPEAILTVVPRLLGLDGRKMSKTYDNFIALSEAPDTIRKKAQNMFTDPQRVRLTDPGHPEKCNVHSYYAVFAPEKKAEIDGSCRQAKIGCTDCKKQLAEILIKLLAPIQEKRRKLLKNKARIWEILSQGNKIANGIAARTIQEARSVTGLR